MSDLLAARNASAVRDEKRQRCSAVGTDVRTLFYRMLHKEQYPQVLPIVRQHLVGWLQQAETAAPSPAAMPMPYAEADPRNTLLRHYSPCGLLEFAWLAGVTQAAVAHSAAATHLFRIYRHTPAARAAYRRWLEANDKGPHDPTSALFCRRPDIVTAAFDAALVRLTLGSFARQFPGEVIGFTQAHARCDTPLMNQLNQVGSETPHRPEGYGSLRFRMGEIKVHGNAAAAAFLANAKSAAEHGNRQRSLARGDVLYGLLHRNLLQAMAEEKARGDLASRVASLIARKVPYGKGQHKQTRLQGRPLDCWLSDTPFQARRFLAALAQSPYVDLARPEKCRLLKAMESGGAMFGVFTEAERHLVRQWLFAGAPLPEDASTFGDEAPWLAPNAAEAHGQPKYLTMDRRTLFHALINSDRHPEVLPVARGLVERVLSNARRQVYRRKAHRLSYFSYDPTTFGARLDALHRREVERYRPFRPPPRHSREAYRWGIEQLAPSVLVDGCWLQNILDAGDSPVTRRLFRILGDEIGNGRLEDNHTNVYRRLLTQLDIRLPEPTTPEFARHTGFLDGAFDLPNYLLSISLFPQSFLPETIGLNLAIELSGLGAGYMGLVDEMTYWDIDPRIVSLHLSIDNLASGHAALARDAVISHLEGILGLGGEHDMHSHWLRILAGYHSLDVAPRFFVRQLVSCYLWKFKVKPFCSRLR